MNILDRTPPKADHRLSYGSLPLQFGELWIPQGSPASQRWPLVVFLHGGWWKSAYDLGYASFLCAAMKSQGVAVWSLEYRRVGDEGGGWPGTMQDIAAGMDHVVKLAEAFPLDTTRVIAAGHSAGGQLAFWLAARHHIPHSSVLAEPAPNLALKGVAALAGAVDLRLTIDLGGFFSFPMVARRCERCWAGCRTMCPSVTPPPIPVHFCRWECRRSWCRVAKTIRFLQRYRCAGSRTRSGRETTWR